MNKTMKIVMAVVLTLTLGLGGLMAAGGRYDAYKQVFADPRWQVKLNTFIEAVGTDYDSLVSETGTLRTELTNRINSFYTELSNQITDLGALVANWITTVDSLTLIQTAPAYSDASTFTMAGDYSSLLTTGKRLVADCGADGLLPNTVVSCTYAAPNSTVVVTAANLTSNLAAVSYYATRNGLNTYGSGDVVAAEYGAPSWANLQSAVVVANASGRRLVITPGNWPVDDDLTITAPIHIVPGGLFAIATTKTLTSNGTLDAGLYQIFSWAGTGKVVLGGPRIAYVQWWGAKGDSTTNDTAAVQAAITAAESGGRVVFPDTGNDYLVTNIQFKYDHQLIEGHGKLRSYDETTSPIVTIGESGVNHTGIKGQLYVKGVSAPDITSYAAMPDIIGVYITALSRAYLTLEVDGCQDNIKLHGTAAKGVASNIFIVPRCGNYKRYGIWITADDTGGAGWVNANTFFGNFIYGKCEALAPTPGTQWAIRLDYSGTNIPNTNKFYNFNMEASTNAVYCNGIKNVFENLRIEPPAVGINFNTVEFGANSYDNRLVLTHSSAFGLDPFTGLGCSADGNITGTFNTVNGITATPADFSDGKLFKVVSANGARYIRVRGFYAGTPNAVSFLENGMPDAPDSSHAPSVLICSGVRDAGTGNEVIGPPPSSDGFLDWNLSRTNMALDSLTLSNSQGYYPLLTLRGSGYGTDHQVLRAMVFNSGGGYDLGFGLTHRGHLYLNNTISTAGSCTINKPTGRVRIPTDATTTIVTNNLFTANSLIFITPNTSLYSATRLWVEAGAGSFNVKIDTLAGSVVDVNFWVIN